MQSSPNQLTINVCRYSTYSSHFRYKLLLQDYYKPVPEITLSDGVLKVFKVRVYMVVCVSVVTQVMELIYV